MKRKLQIIISFVIFILILFIFLNLQNFKAFLCPTNTNKGFAAPTANEDDYNIEWETIFSDGKGKDIVVNSLDEVFSVGYTSVGDKLVIQKFSESGDLEWMETREETDMIPESITCDDQNYLYITGSFGSNTFGYNAKLFILKYNSDGTCLKYITLSEFECGSSIITDRSNNVYIVGYNNGKFGPGNQLILLKFNNNLDLQWQVILDDSDAFTANDIKIDNYIYVTGSLPRTDANRTDHDAILVKFDLNGNQIWRKTWGNTNYNHGNAIIISRYVYLVGTTSTPGHSGFLLKYDHDGNLLWENIGEQDYDWNDLLITPQNEILVGGQFYFISEVYTALICFNSNGNQEWIKYWGDNSESSWRTIRQMDRDSNFNIYAVGLSNPGIYTFKYAFIGYTPTPNQFPMIPIIAFTVPIIFVLGIIVSLIILYRNSIIRKKSVINDRYPYSNPAEISKENINLGEKSRQKCPFCSFIVEENGEYCPQCGEKIQ